MSRNNSKRSSKRQAKAIGTVIASIVVIVAGAASAIPSCSNSRGAISSIVENLGAPASHAASAESLEDIPEYDGEAYVVIDADSEDPLGSPDFSEDEIDRAENGAFEDYSPLDREGRCGEALACLGPETMPTEPRGDIHEIHPSGWDQAFYDFVENEALYNRSHLIAHSLSGEDANERNLITGTRSMNADGMRPFEEEVARYIDDTGNHVLYRATPIFSGTELVARGVQVEAFSMEDDGAGICFNIYFYNVEPGVVIDYETGESWAA